MHWNGYCRSEEHIVEITIHVFDGTEGRKENPQQGSRLSDEKRTWKNPDDDLLTANFALQLNSSVDCGETSHCSV
jgi:hypothetical protein